MKRSDINQSIGQAIEFFRRMQFPLPSFAFWSPQEWRTKGQEYAEIFDLSLGWDVTDFGSGDLNQFGRTIFSLRNGIHGDPRYPKTYAQKAMFLLENQRSPVHHHRRKMEDIVNHGKGNILIALWHVSATGGIDDVPVEVSISGKRTMQPAGAPLGISPGESICLPPLTYHQFWAEEGHGPVLSVEVSSVCDDYRDNVFLETVERFPAIEEDEPPGYVLCHEYSAYVRETACP